MTPSSPAVQLFEFAVSVIADRAPAHVLELAELIFSHHLRNLQNLLDAVDRAWGLHRDAGGPAPTAEITAWRDAWARLLDDIEGRP